VFETVLAPDDIGEADTALVLGFLNEAATAADLREALGLSEGATVGDLVAASLIERRDALGGFTELAQVQASRFVTPLRFTEIVVALSNAAPPRLAPRDRGAVAGSTAPLRADDRLSLRIEPMAPVFWLGQRTTVTLRLQDAAGASVLDAPVTCWTSWGRLAARHELCLDRGASVFSRSGTAGLLTVRLESPLTSPVSDAERALLEAELSRLDPSAEGTPAAAREALQQIIARYRAEGGGVFRAVIDRLFEELGPPPASNPNAPWPTIPVTLLAVAEGPRGGAPTVRTATLRARDWRGAWLAALREVLLNDRQVDKALDDALSGESGPSVERLVGAARTFAGLERGGVAAGIRELIASIALNRFVDANATRLGEAVTEVATGVGSATGAITRGGLVVLDTIERARSTTPVTADLGSLKQRLDGLERSQITAADLTALEGRVRTETSGILETALSGLSAEVERKLDRSSFDQQFRDLLGQVTRLEETTLSRDALDGLCDQLTAAAVDAARARVERAVEGLSERFVMAEQFQEVRERTTGLSSRIERLEGSVITRDRLDARASEIEAAALDAARRKVSELARDLRREFVTAEALGAVSERTARIEGRVVALETRVVTRDVLEGLGTAIERQAVDAARARMDELTGQLRQDFASSADLDSMHQQLAGKADATAVTSLRGDLSRLTADSRAVSTRLEALDGRVATLGESIRPRRGPGGPS
jgi:hypothetical protein